MDYDTTPVLTPPNGQQPNFDAPYNSIQIGTIAAFGVTYSLATSFVGLRYFQAIRLSKKVEVDLVIITIAYLISMIYFITLIDMVNHGWGKHMWDINFTNFVKLLKRLRPNSLTYIISPSITRIAMLSILYRINPSFTYRCITVAIGVAMVLYTLALSIVIGGPCNIETGRQSCLEVAIQVHAVLNIFFDLAVIVLPIPTIHHLHLPPKQKIVVGSILALGSSVVICSIVRLPYIVIVKSQGDVTYNQGFLGIWSTIEINLGIMCVCATRMKPLFSTYFPQLGIFSSRSKGSNRQSYRQSWSKGLRLGQSNDHNSHQLQSAHGGVSGMELERRDIRVDRTYKVDIEYTGRRASASGSAVGSTAESASGSTKGILN